MGRQPQYDDEYDNFYVHSAAADQRGVRLTNGRKAAFCANYESPKKPLLYVKDLRTGL